MLTFIQIGSEKRILSATLKIVVRLQAESSDSPGARIGPRLAPVSTYKREQLTG
jgi:hypothetical protein